MELFGVCIATHNCKPMVDFYTKLFGYEPYIDGPDHRFLAAQLILFELEDAEAPATKDAALVYRVADVDQKFSRLSDLGIAGNPPTDKPWGVRSFTIHDPDGNVISFFTNLP